jgi:hypothetical protein
MKLEVDITFQSETWLPRHKMLTARVKVEARGIDKIL